MLFIAVYYPVRWSAQALAGGDAAALAQCPDAALALAACLGHADAGVRAAAADGDAPPKKPAAKRDDGPRKPLAALALAITKVQYEPLSWVVRMRQALRQASSPELLGSAAEQPSRVSHFKGQKGAIRAKRSGER